MKLEPNTVNKANIFEALLSMPDASVDAVVTDPPYSSGGQFRGDRMQSTAVKYINTDSVQTCRDEFTGDNRDQRSFMTWCSLWLSECLRVTKPGGVLVVFSDWRQLPTITDAVQCGGWVWRNIVTWWKPGCRMQRGRFSASAEYAIYATHGIPTPGQKSPQNVLLFAPVAGKEKRHIAQKPIELMETILGIVPDDGTVLDPFCGSGTTLVAAKRLGLKYIGVDISESCCTNARQRLAEEDGAIYSKEGKELANQASLFGQE